MESVNDQIREYTRQLSQGTIQNAYRFIMTFMTDLQADWKTKYVDFSVGSLYYGCMDMTYFSCTPAFLKNRKLKLAIVYLHKEHRFECWLAAVNRRIQKAYVTELRTRDMGSLHVSEIRPGVDAIIAVTLGDDPDFDKLDYLKQRMESAFEEFIDKIQPIIEGIDNLYL